MDDRICNVLDHIEADLSKKLTLHDLAQVACMSATHFHKVFRRETGKTPFGFIEEIKMAAAYDRLLQGEVKVQDLAIQLGYEDYETFSRAFKKHFFFAPDDLKAIAKKVMEKTGVRSGELIIKTLEDYPDPEKTEDLVRSLMSTLQEKGYSIKDISKLNVISIEPKSLDADKNSLIKNKFMIGDNASIWRAILKNQYNEH